MTRINTNIAAFRSIRQLNQNFDDLSVRLERLSTGLRINSGRDDPAGLIKSERLRFEIRAIGQALQNSSRANNVISTTEGALNEANALLLDMQALIVEASNKGAFTPEELNANQLQIDSILSSLDRIANTTEFANKKLLDGSEAYLLSTIPASALAAISVFAARIPQNGRRDITVTVTQSAQAAQVSFIGGTAGGISTTSASTIEIHGPLGTEVLSFASGTTMADISNSINSISEITGISAVVSSPAVATIASAVILSTTRFGSDTFISVTPISGNFVESSNNNNVIHDAGQDAGVLIDGQLAFVRGLRADVRSNSLDARIHLTQTFGQTLSSAIFTITGGGTLFQLTPEVTPNGQIHLGLPSIRSTQLGNPIVGRLSTLRSGEQNDLSSENFLSAQEIVLEAVDQISAYRGRLGNIQKNIIDTNIRSQGIALENVTASESIIRDAEMAVELSALTRAQILVQSTQSALQIANSIPNLVLALLG